MPKNVVLCCDGTANEFAQDRTNVVKLFFTLARDPSRQVAYYHPGLGTMERPGALTRFTRTVTRVLGRAFGYGLEADIRDAYVFLMNREWRSCLPVRVQSWRIYRTRSSVAAAHVWPHSERQRLAGAVCDPNANCDQQHQPQARRPHRRGKQLLQARPRLQKHLFY